MRLQKRVGYDAAVARTPNPNPYEASATHITQDRMKAMGSLARYLYIVAMDVDPDKETRFNKWYNEEHVPALLKVPGVLGAYRYVSLEGRPKYTAIYELDNPSVRASARGRKQSK